SASHKRVELEQIEIIPADQLAENIGGFAGARHADPGKGVTGHSGEDAVLLLVIKKIEIRIRIAPGEVTVAGKKLHYPIGMSDREGRKSKVLTIPKMVVLTPMPSAMAMKAMAKNPGLLIKLRIA